MKASLLGSCILVPCAFAYAQPVTIELQLVNGGLTEPVAIANAGPTDDRLFVVERAGTVRILRADGTWEPQPFLDITDRVNDGGGEQGLLGLTFHPNYASNGYIYVHYCGGTGVGTSKVSRFTRNGSNPNDVVESTEFTIWTVNQPGPNTNHRGGDVHFGPDGYLWVGLGDAGGSGDPSNYAQNLTLPFGKILRLDVNGGSPYAIPSSNPYVGAGGGILPEIWGSGLRNPWRFSIDELTGDVWIGDVGQSGYEEIDRWPGGDHSGPNFGWRCYEGTVPYNTTGCAAQNTYVQPITTHALSGGFCAIVGGHIYRGTNFSRLAGRYIYTDWCLGRFITLAPNGNGYTSETVLESGIMGFAAIGENGQGELYTCNQQTGDVYRIADPAATVRVSAKVFLDGPYDSSTDRMRDALRTAGQVPTGEPYGALGFVRRGWGGERTTSTVLGVSGDNAIVDWVRLELRQSGAAGTILATASALLQRDGDIVGVDGTSPVAFTAMPGNYHVAVRHRNHMGCMTSGAVALSSTAATVDLRLASTSAFGTNARKTVGSRQVLWSGNVVRDARLSYIGTDNDRDPILQAIGGVIPTNTITGYRVEDVNLDGTVKYTGENNDRDVILQNIGGVVPTNTLPERLP